MKESPEQKALHDRLLPGRISAEGFLGNDSRTPAQIIEQDLAVLARAGYTQVETAHWMSRLTDAGQAGIGSPVILADRLEVTVVDDRGFIPCPFADAYRAAKRLTCVLDMKTGVQAQWTDLNIHMIEKHGFFEGQGSYFRLEPATLIEIMESPD